jgi:hypothetical protein
MQWYYSKNGTQLGPIGTEELQSKLASGEVAPGDLVWKDGMADWLPAGQVAELRAAAPSSPVANVQPAAPAEPSPYQSPVAVQSPPQAPTMAAMPGAPLSQGFAIASMICGIIAVLTCCMWCLSGPLAIVAVVLGHIAISKIKTEPAKFGGKGLAKTGLITGYLALLLTLLVTIFSFWAQTLSPEKIEQMEFLPKEMREEMQKQREQKNPTRIETP